MQNKINVLLALFDIGYQKQDLLNKSFNSWQKYNKKEIDDAREFLFEIIYRYQTRLTDED